MILNFSEKGNNGKLLAAFGAVGGAVLALFLLLRYFTPLPLLFCILIALCVLAGGGALCVLLLYRSAPVFDDREQSDLNAKISPPAVICDKDGRILWHNRAFSTITGKHLTHLGGDFFQMAGIPKDTVKDGAPIPTRIHGTAYDLLPSACHRPENAVWMFVLTDTTERDRLKEQQEKERTVVGILTLDNIEELSRGGQDKYRNEINTVLDILRDFAGEHKAILRETGYNDYTVLMAREEYLRCIEEHFPVLGRVREVRIGNRGLSITISMGFAEEGASLADRERIAREHLNIALTRGGDQVIYQLGTERKIFGGNTLPVQKQSRVAAKVRSAALADRIASAPNVLIMGHKNADADCLGAAVGLARLCLYCGVPPFILTEEDPNTKAVLLPFAALPEYKDVFVSADEAKDLIRPDTLLIVVDVNNTSHMLSEDILVLVQNRILIDHHRQQNTNNGPDWQEAYLEPSVSSTSELVSEILEQGLGEGELLKEEADALLAGIMLDTRKFSKSTGTRTLSAAMFLRSKGASISEAVAGLRVGFPIFRIQARILQNVTLYRDRFAIASDPELTDTDGRIAASLAAEAMLSIRGVDAAFALIRTEKAVLISARSDSNFNVQRVMERLYGGGHFGSAGAAVSAEMEDVLSMLQKAITATEEDIAAENLRAEPKVRGEKPKPAEESGGEKPTAPEPENR